MSQTKSGYIINFVLSVTSYGKVDKPHFQSDAIVVAQPRKEKRREIRIRGNEMLVLPNTRKFPLYSQSS
jgi:hypothetical protein